MLDRVETKAEFGGDETGKEVDGPVKDYSCTNVGAPSLRLNTCVSVPSFLLVKTSRWCVGEAGNNARPKHIDSRFVGMIRRASEAAGSIKNA